MKKRIQVNFNKMIEGIDNFYGYFNLALSIVLTLIGFKIYWPFKKEKEEEVYRKFGNMYKFGGIALIVWGLIKVL